ncbi:hypothetical protein AAVH_38729 [Aphelenchoides avenae]|nr:hypothetical protein AAVH_38729 [Aphelenchus avenae]
MSFVGKIILVVILAIFAILQIAQSAPAPQFGPGGARGTGPAGDPSEISIGSPALLG